MVVIIERNRDFKFLTNKELLEQAKINSKKQGTTLSKALDLFVKQVAITFHGQLRHQGAQAGGYYRRN